jgi:hypothetical protein
MIFSSAFLECHMHFLPTFQERYSKRCSILGIKGAWWFGSNEMADPTKGNSPLFLMTLHSLMIV